MNKFICIYENCNKIWLGIFFPFIKTIFSWYRKHQKILYIFIFPKNTYNFIIF